MKRTRLQRLALVLSLILVLTCFSASFAVAEQTAPVKFFTRTNANKETAPDNELVLAEIEKRSGIQLDVVALANESYGDTMNLKIIGEDVFDGFNLVGANGISYTNLIDRGSILPLNDLIDAYGPNIKEHMASAFAYLNMDEGQIWDLPRSEMFTMGFVPAIRQDWLDQLNMEMPTTLAQLEAYFEAVLVNDMNGNGDPNDEIPYLGDGFLYGMSNFSAYFFGNAMTNLDATQHYLDSEGVVRSVYEHPNFKLMLETFARWYQKGYMHPEANILTTTQRADLRTADRVGCTSGWYSTGIAAELTLRENGKENALYVPLAPLTDCPEGGVAAWPSNPLFDHQTVVMKTSENAEYLIKYFDWMLSSPENLALVGYGLEGVHWEWYDKEANVIKLTEKSGNYSGFYMLGNLYYYPQMPTLYVSPDAGREYEVRVMQDKIRNEYTYQSGFDAGIAYNYAGTEAEMLTNDGWTMVEEAATKIILGQMSIDEWDHVVETYKAIEGDVYSAVWTEQYNAAKGK